MTDIPQFTPRHGLQTRARDILKRGAAVAPMMRPIVRYVPKHPVLLIGAAALGVVGMVAWRNREQIRAKAAPLLQSAAEQGAALANRLPFLQSRERMAVEDPTLH